jgi:hypothetical protein
MLKFVIIVIEMFKMWLKGDPYVTLLRFGVVEKYNVCRTSLCLSCTERSKCLCAPDDYIRESYK